MALPVRPMLLQYCALFALGLILATASFEAIRTTTPGLNLQQRESPLVLSPQPLTDVQSDTAPQNGTYPAVLPLDVDEAAMMFVTPDFYALNASLHWASLIPCGHGWVRLGEAREPFAVSMYHQIHCLNGIRSALLSPPSERTPHGDGHMNHCFNYLRQLLVCRADTTLEPTQIIRKDGKVFAAASGEGVVHKCRDWTQIRRFVEDNMLHARSE